MCEHGLPERRRVEIHSRSGVRIESDGPIPLRSTEVHAVAVFFDEEVREFACLLGQALDLRPGDIVELLAIPGVFAEVEKPKPKSVRISLSDDVLAL